MSSTFMILLLFGSQILTFALPVNLNLSIAQKWAFNDTQPSSNSASTTSQCPEDEIYLMPQGLDPGCYPKVKALYQACLRNEQCTVAKSYCGFHEANDYEEHICVCNPGFVESVDNSTCEKHRECHLKDFNDAYHQADCAKNQFCRQGSCLCKPKYRFNSDGLCEWDVPDEPEPSDQDVGFWNTIKNELWAKVVLCIGIIVALSLGVFLPIAFCVLGMRKNNDQKDSSKYAKFVDSSISRRKNKRIKDEQKRLTKIDEHEDEGIEE